MEWSKAKGNRIRGRSARVSWYETQLLIGQPNGGSPKFKGGSPKLFFLKLFASYSTSFHEILLITFLVLSSAYKGRMPVYMGFWGKLHV